MSTEVYISHHLQDAPRIKRYTVIDYPHIFHQATADYRDYPEESETDLEITRTFPNKWEITGVVGDNHHWNSIDGAIPHRWVHNSLKETEISKNKRIGGENSTDECSHSLWSNEEK